MFEYDETDAHEQTRDIQNATKRAYADIKRASALRERRDAQRAQLTLTNEALARAERRERNARALIRALTSMCYESGQEYES